MNPRLRLVIVIAIVIIIIGVVAAVVLPTLTNTTPADDTSDSTTEGGGSTTSSGPTDTPEPTITPIEMVDLVIAVQQIPRGFTIPPNAVISRPWPKLSAPSSAIFNLESVIGKKARTDIFREQPILTNMLVDDLANLASVGSDAAAVLPNNRVAVSIPMDRITSVAYAIQPGDRVDVMVTLLFVNVDPVFQSIEPSSITLQDLTTGSTQAGIQGYEQQGSQVQFGEKVFRTIVSPSERQRPRMVTQRTVQEALVVWVGDFPIGGRLFFVVPSPTPVPTVDPDAGSGSSSRAKATSKPTAIPPRPDIITLAVSPQDAVVLTWMMEARLPLTFALRSATSTSQVPTDPVNLQYITETFRIDIPGNLDYSIEPAPTSIRQLFVGKSISLNG
jgi:Flp pilus assembly protein CpaB